MLTQAPAGSPTEWVLDSGASSHLTSDATNMLQPIPYQGANSISIANGSTLPINSFGDGLLPLPPSNCKLYLHNLLHVPSLSHNLLSIHKLTTDNNCSISFDALGFQITDLQDNQIILHGRSRDGLYLLSANTSKAPNHAL
ncbi:hypothetical protein KFK09_018387 [Dendrobium nobile]|uniref:Retrovirus-related Pol polyprotein from transposon TNT 1-94-like beta-barrel domain-containing protein n=1 Tax=Dendrobium nobile TaxID=94219 RepID=A0A8T3AVX2_DENNO|nr:hypothetical protein KFK09_018387 [Dendrobium nobile]